MLLFRGRNIQARRERKIVRIRIPGSQAAKEGDARSEHNELEKVLYGNTGDRGRGPRAEMGA